MLSQNRLRLYKKLLDAAAGLPYVIEATTMQDEGFLRLLMHRIYDERNTMTCEFRMIVDADEFDRPFIRLFLDSQSIKFNGRDYRFDGYRIGLIDEESFVVRMIEAFFHE